MISNKEFFISPITVLSGSSGKLLFEYVASHFETSIKELKAEEAKFNEFHRVISTIGADKRDIAIKHILSEIHRLVDLKKLKVIEPIESDSEDEKVTYKVSGSKLIKKASENDLFKFSPRSGLNSIVIVKRRDDKDKLIDSYDILEYKDGELIAIVAGGVGETSIDGLGEMAKDIDIYIAAGPQLTKSEIKSREKAAAFHIKEAFAESRKKKEEVDLLERLKEGPKEKEDKGEEAMKSGKIVDLSESPERVEKLASESKKRNNGK